MTTTENTKAIIKNFKTIELWDISKRRKTSKVRPYTIPTVSNTSRAVSAPRLIFRTELGGADQSLGWKSISESWN